MSRRRGVTMIELLVVIAVIGILSGLAGYSVSMVNDIGRVNGASQTLGSVLRNARARAITERCTYVVQVNGPDYAPTGPPDVRRAANQILLWRKNNCLSTTGAYEPGLAANLRDRLIDSYSLREFQTNFIAPPGVLGVPDNTLRAHSISFSWRGDGTRDIWIDTDGDGTSTQLGFAGIMNLSMLKRRSLGDVQRNVSIPVAGPAESQ